MKELIPVCSDLLVFVTMIVVHLGDNPWAPVFGYILPDISAVICYSPYTISFPLQYSMRQSTRSRQRTIQPKV